MDASATGTLYVVATPIGNLEDITLRALRILREVDLVAAEDTRRSRQLLQHYGIATPLVSLHEHNERTRGRELVARLRAGSSVALVTDAGTPGVSDPGAAFVRTARAQGIRVDPVPGPSAVTAALSASGLEMERFAFAGFPPVRPKDRKAWLAWVESLSSVAVVLFEAPHRIHKTLAVLRDYLADRPITVVRELTKLHESWTSWPAHASIDVTTVPPRGEFVVLVGPREVAGDEREAAHTPSDAEIAARFGRTTNYTSRREAVRAVAGQLGLPVKHVYEALERAKSAEN